MDRLSSCYFCGIALDKPLETYRVSGSASESELAVTLCVTCHQKLDMILDATAVGVTDPLPRGKPSAETPDDAQDGSSAETFEGSPDELLPDSATDDSQDERSAETADEDDSPADPLTDSDEDTPVESLADSTDDTPDEPPTDSDEDSSQDEQSTEITGDETPDEQSTETAEDDSSPSDVLIDLDIGDGPPVIDPQPSGNSPVQNDERGVIDEPDALADAAAELAADDDSDDDLDARFEAEFPETLDSGEEQQDESVAVEDRSTGTVDDDSTGTVDDDSTEEGPATRADNDSAVTDPDTSERADVSEQTSVDTETDTSPETEADTKTDTTDNEKAASDGTASTGDEETSQPESSTQSAESSPQANISALEYNKVMRLLQNRAFPVDRHEIEQVASSAYDFSKADCGAVIDLAIDRGLLTEKGGKLFRPE